MNEKRECPARGARLSGLPVTKLSMPTTSWPSLNNRSQRCEPKKPAAPVIKMRIKIPPKNVFACQVFACHVIPDHVTRKHWVYFQSTRVLMPSLVNCCASPDSELTNQRLPW